MYTTNAGNHTTSCKHVMDDSTPQKCVAYHNMDVVYHVGFDMNLHDKSWSREPQMVPVEQLKLV